MTVTLVNDLVKLLGKPSNSSDVATQLEQLSLGMPKLKRGETTTTLVARRHGLEIGFADEAYHSGRKDIKPREGRLILTTIWFNSSGVSGFSQFSGELPLGIKFAHSKDQVRAILGPPNREVSFMNRDLWERGQGQRVTVGYGPDDRSVTYMMMFLRHAHDPDY